MNLYGRAFFTHWQGLISTVLSQFHTILKHFLDESTNEKKDHSNQHDILLHNSALFVYLTIPLHESHQQTQMKVASFYLLLFEQFSSSFLYHPVERADNQAKLGLFDDRAYPPLKLVSLSVVWQYDGLISLMNSLLKKF